MEIVVLLIVVVVVIGALLGGKSFGGTIRAGCGFLIVLTIILLGIFYFSNAPSDGEKAGENQETNSTIKNSGYFIVKEDCQAFTKPNIESDIADSLDTGVKVYVKEANKYNYFYEVNTGDGSSVFVLKERLKRK